MDKDAHKIRKQNREMSYNNILMDKYESADGTDSIRDTNEKYKF